MSETHNASVLENENAEQVTFMEEQLIAVSERDIPLGPVSKYDAHHQAGSFHRAFSVLLFNSDNKLLLQRRSIEKVTFPGVWANSCCSHPLYVDEEMIEMIVEKGATKLLPAAVKDVFLF